MSYSIDGLSASVRGSSGDSDESEKNNGDLRLLYWKQIWKSKRISKFSIDSSFITFMLRFGLLDLQSKTE